MNNKQAFVLCRISDEKQASGYSLAAQEKYAKEYCKKYELEILKVYSFIETGSKPGKRSKFDGLMREIKSTIGKSKKVFHLVVEKPDRLTRNFTNREQLQIFVMQGRLKIHYYKDKRIIDSSCSPAEIFTDNIMTALNKYTADNIRRESQKGMKEKAAQGIFPGRAPLGYKNIREGKENKHGRKEAKIIIDNESKDAVIRIFELRATKNMSYYAIAQKIKEERLLPPHKELNFRKQNVEKILNNIFYGGKFKWIDEIYQGNHEVFVPKEYFNLIHSVKPKKAKKRPYGTYSLLLTCGVDGCGSTVIYDPKVKTIKSTGETKEYKYYHCCDGKFFHKENKVKQVNVSEKAITNQFEQIFDEIHFTENLTSLVSEALRESHAKSIKLHKEKVSIYKEKLKNLEYKEDRVYDDHLKGLLDEEGYKRQIKRVRSERDSYTNLLSESDELICDNFFETADKLLELTKYSKSLWKLMTPTERVELVKEVTSNRELEGATLRYSLKKPFKVLSEIKNLGQFDKWCPGLDLNQHGRSHTPLKRACLPISPPGQEVII